MITGDSIVLLPHQDQQRDIASNTAHTICAMSTQIYPLGKYTQSEINDLVSKQAENEVTWYISEVINNQVDSIKDVLQSCISHLDETDSTTYKLPLSSHKSEVLKGTVTRQNFKICDMHLVINCRSFNGGRKSEYRMVPGQHIILRQLLDCHDGMVNALANITKIEENEKHGNNPERFVRYMDMVCSHVSIARKSLLNPDPAYEFPRYRTNGKAFEPLFPKTAAVDFTIGNGEMTVEFRSLSLVDKRPWNVVTDPMNKLSFADIVRKQISAQRGVPMNKIIMDNYTEYLEWRKSHPESKKGPTHEEESGLGSTIKNIFTSNSDPSVSTLIKTAPTYLEQSITYMDDRNQPFVVKVIDKCEVVTSDPVLLSISVKLESIEKTLLRIQGNLGDIYKR